MAGRAAVLCLVWLFARRTSREMQSQSVFPEATLVAPFSSHLPGGMAELFILLLLGMLVTGLISKQGMDTLSMQFLF